MRLRSISSVLALAIAAVSFSQYSATLYYPPAGYTGVYAYGAGNGQFVGSGTFNNGLNLGALLWNGGPTPVELTDNSYRNSEALACAGGQQVGYVRPYSGSSSAVLWTGTAASMVVLGQGTPTIHFVAYGTDGTQQVGWVVSNGVVEACMWSGSAASRVSLAPAGAIYSIAYSVANGVQSGYYYVNAFRAAVWQGSAASMVDIHPDLLGVSSQAYATDGTQFAGSVYTAQGEYHAMLWTGASAAQAVDLHPVGDVMSEAYDVGNGLQVGYSFDPTWMSRALAWQGSNSNRIELNDFLPSNIAYTSAYSVDEAGNIVGYGYDLLTNEYVAIKWTPDSVPGYTTAGLTAPFTEGATYNKNRTIPLRFSLTNSEGNAVMNETATISLETVSPVAGPVASSVFAKAPWGTSFRYDAETQQYVYNLSTKNLQSGTTYKITVTLSTGQTITGTFTVS